MLVKLIKIYFFVKLFSHCGIQSISHEPNQSTPEPKYRRCWLSSWLRYQMEILLTNIIQHSECLSQLLAPYLTSGNVPKKIWSKQSFSIKNCGTSVVKVTPLEQLFGESGILYSKVMRWKISWCEMKVVVQNIEHVLYFESIK